MAGETPFKTAPTSPHAGIPGDNTPQPCRSRICTAAGRTALPSVRPWRRSRRRPCRARFASESTQAIRSVPPLPSPARTSLPGSAEAGPAAQLRPRPSGAIRHSGPAEVCAGAQLESRRAAREGGRGVRGLPPSWQCGRSACRTDSDLRRTCGPLAACDLSTGDGHPSLTPLRVGRYPSTEAVRAPLPSRIRVESASPSHRLPGSATGYHVSSERSSSPRCSSVCPARTCARTQAVIRRRPAAGRILFRPGPR